MFLKKKWKKDVLFNALYDGVKLASWVYMIGLDWVSTGSEVGISHLKITKLKKKKKMIFKFNKYMFF